MTQALAERQDTEVIQSSEPVGYNRMIEMAVQTGDLDKVEKMMDLQAKWEAQQAKKSYDKAIASFKENAPDIVKNKKGHNTQYADLAQVVAKATPVLSNYGLSSSWQTRTAPEKKIVSVTCKVSHVDGHSESVEMSEMYEESGNKNRMQAMASAVSYLERYTFMAITGLAARGMDDDGLAASPKPNLEVNELHAFMLAGDALGVYLLLKTATQEQQMDWYWWPAQPKGLKGHCKTHLENMQAAGQELYRCILDSIESESEVELCECMDAATSETKRMLAADIGAEKTASIKALLSKVEQ